MKFPKRKKVKIISQKKDYMIDELIGWIIFSILVMFGIINIPDILNLEPLPKLSKIIASILLGALVGSGLYFEFSRPEKKEKEEIVEIEDVN